MKPPAPVFVDAFTLCEWLIGRLGSDPRVLPQSLCRTSLRLLEAVTLALRGSEHEDRVEEADERLAALRVQIRLAAATDYLTDAQAMFAIEAADRIGRQLGGWRRSLGAV